MIRSGTFRSFFLIVALATAACAQTALNYGFVSPNTKENLKLEDAIKGLNSTEETKLVRQSINMSCVVRSRIRAFRSLGSWSDGAEHSVMIRVQSDEPTVRYVLSRLGRDARQKSILYFHPQLAGTADLYTLKPRRPTRNIASLAKRLERAGLEFRTLVPVKSGTWIYVVDLKRELRAKVMAAAQRLRARVSYESGNANFVGDDQVDEAKVVFDEEIRRYETHNPNLPPTCDVQKRHKQTPKEPKMKSNNPCIRATVSEALEGLPGPNGQRFATVFQHGSLLVEIYAPRGTDPQQPHTRDEVYFVAAGSGEFVCGETRQTFGATDILFAAAGAVHRFENFSGDLTLWVIFYGPEGGESNQT